MSRILRLARCRQRETKRTRRKQHDVAFYMQMIMIIIIMIMMMMIGMAVLLYFAVFKNIFEIRIQFSFEAVGTHVAQLKTPQTQPRFTGRGRKESGAVVGNTHQASRIETSVCYKYTPSFPLFTKIQLPLPFSFSPFLLSLFFYSFFTNCELFLSGEERLEKAHYSTSLATVVFGVASQLASSPTYRHSPLFPVHVYH